ncbi:MAG: glycerophosphodiester phosphodiesterase [Thermoanaerobaculia bacterium]
MSLRALPPVPVALAGRPRPLVMAHRGNSAAAPENTRASFERAVEDGADLVETDLHLTRDGVFVCIHDATLDRTGGVPVAVADVTLSELKKHPVSFGRAGFENEFVPTLEELIALLPPRTGLALELKTDRFLEPEVARRLGEALRAFGLLDRTAVLSFAFERCRVVKREIPDVFAGFITMRGALPAAGEAQMVGPFWPVLFANPFLPWLAHRRGLFVAPLDDTPDRLLWYYRLLGCDAVLTNDPAATLRKLGRSRT